MSLATHCPRTPRSFQPDPVKSLSGLFVLGLVTLALVAPNFAHAQAFDDGTAPGWPILAGLTDSDVRPCDASTPSALDSADPRVTFDSRVVHLGSLQSDAPNALDPSAFLVRVTADGRQVTALCEGMRFLEVTSAATAATVVDADVGE
ncbi:MAG: hypothetical protein AAF184_23835 [Pseudomonadota bacterium]